MTTKLVIAAVLCVATLAIAGEKTAPFRHPKAVQAWNRYQFREAKAREAYDREMAAAKSEYTAGLKEAATLAAKAGDAEDLKAISDAVSGDPSPESLIVGSVWRVGGGISNASVLTFSPNQVTRSGSLSLVGSWRMIENAKLLVITWPNNQQWIVVLDSIHGSYVNTTTGDAGGLTRQSPPSQASR